MKNSKLVFMTIIGLSAALVASESQVEVTGSAVELATEVQESAEAVAAKEESVEVVAPAETTEVATEVQESTEAVVATEESVEVVAPVVEKTYVESVTASYNDFVAFSSEKMTTAYKLMNESMTEVSVYAQANPAITASVATATVVTIAGVSYYAYTQCGKNKEVKKN